MSETTRRHWSKTGRLWFSVIAAILIVGLGCVTILNWNWLNSTEPDPNSEMEEPRSAVTSNGETLRNVSLVIGGLVALVFAFWRSWVTENRTTAAQQQVAAALGQVEAAQHQATTAHNDFLNPNPPKGCGSGVDTRDDGRGKTNRPGPIPTDGVEGSARWPRQWPDGSPQWRWWAKSARRQARSGAGGLDWHECAGDSPWVVR